MHPEDQRDLRAGLDALQRSRFRSFPPAGEPTVEWLRSRFEAAALLGLIPDRWRSAYDVRTIDVELQAWGGIAGPGFGATVCE